MNYVDRLTNRVEHANRKLSPDTNLHLQRSCYAAILLEECQQARVDGTSTDVFGMAAIEVIDDTALPIFDAIDAHNTLPGKRQPSLRESVGATVDRLNMIDELEVVFGGPVESIMYGGSMKYGPFMNVRSGADASDIDMIAITTEEVLADLDWRGLMDSALIDERDKLTFFARFGLQRAMYENHETDIMSQRFTAADKGYTISTHFIPKIFVDEAFPQTSDAITDGDDRHRYLRDYKERPFERAQVTNFDMSRRQHGIAVHNRAVAGGFIASNPAYSVVEGRYVPGMYQNLVLPGATPAFDQTGEATWKFRQFTEAVAEQEQHEQSIDPKASILNTEPRKPIIPADVRDILRT